MLENLNVPGEVVLLGLCGSKAYGLDTPTSDEDYRGVYLTAARDLWTFNRPAETVERVTDTVDVSVHEVQKFMKLAMGGNPSVLEVLWLPEYVTRTREGFWLTDNRQLFLSGKVRSSFCGYAQSQVAEVKKMHARPDFGDLGSKVEKVGRHAFRLMLQGYDLVTTGELTVRLRTDQVDGCWAAGELARTEPDVFAATMTALYERIVQAKSVLPPNPDTAAVNCLLQQFRETTL